MSKAVLPVVAATFLALMNASPAVAQLPDDSVKTSYHYYTSDYYNPSPYSYTVPPDAPVVWYVWGGPVVGVFFVLVIILSIVGACRRAAIREAWRRRLANRQPLITTVSTTTAATAVPSVATAYPTATATTYPTATTYAAATAYPTATAYPAASTNANIPVASSYPVAAAAPMANAGNSNIPTATALPAPLCK